MTNGYGGRELAAAFRTGRKKTLQIANEIPEEKYDFIVAPGVKSVRAILTHIAYVSRFPEDAHRVKHLTTIQGYDFGGHMGFLAGEEAKSRTKAEIIELLETKGEDFA